MKHALSDIPGIGPSTADLLGEHGIDSVKALLKGGMKALTAVPGFGPVRAANVLNAAEALKDEKPEKAAKKEKKAKKEKSADKPKKKKDGKKKGKKKKK